MQKNDMEYGRTEFTNDSMIQIGWWGEGSRPRTKKAASPLSGADRLGSWERMEAVGTNTNEKRVEMRNGAMTATQYGRR